MVSRSSNLEVFLEAATPRLPWRSAPMDCFRGPDTVWQLEKKHSVDYFTLEDLWEHYSESSAYGLAVPVRLHHQTTGKSITQHFVPYLSAIQIYTAKALAAVPSRSTESETDSWSDDNSVGDKDSRSWDAASSYDSSHEDLDDPTVRSKQGGYLNFQYSECDPPYERIPLADKVAELAQDYPCLTSLNSAELSPSSWLSVAWYPIYHIPYHGNLKGISACFLTYHSISTVFQDEIIVRCGGDRTVALSPFGLATYRMEAGKRLWTEPHHMPAAAAGSGGGSPNAAAASRLSVPSSHSDLYWAASSWLKQVGAHHPDFNFFTAHGSAIR
ncbi:hypothetical protein BDA96_04G379400 [Sorghum bicolor]|uniref:Uncharacterized protein n=1 Tax=Sorghum bicolor TaxID=4558 RepID=A0A921R9I4_SORBI|nr:hypothetical protein BDA96_04G379400 [Sorghum bicolor]